MVRLHRGELANLEVDHVAEQGTNLEIVFIFAGDLAGLAANACLLVEIKAFPFHGSPLFLFDVVIWDERGIVGNGFPGPLFKIGDAAVPA